jgi:hypothetical protein
VRVYRATLSHKGSETGSGSGVGAETSLKEDLDLDQDPKKSFRIRNTGLIPYFIILLYVTLKNKLVTARQRVKD